MRWTPVAIAIQVVILAAIVTVFVVPAPVKWLFLGIALALIVANFLRVFWTFRQERRWVDAVIAAHPGETVFGTGLIAFDDVTASERARVVAVIVTRSGLSFRDRDDAEVAQLASTRILSVELAPLEPKTVRPAVVSLIDGAPVRFWVGAAADQQAENIVAIRTALGRT